MLLHFIVLFVSLNVLFIGRENMGSSKPPCVIILGHLMNMQEHVIVNILISARE